MKKRVFGLDLVRVVALILVMLVHSFFYSDFNSQPLNSLQSFILLYFRNIAFVGVLLFITLTGYLKTNKKLDKNHYKSLINVLLVYFIVSIITVIYRNYVLHTSVPLVLLLIGIFNYTAAPYAWYVEMYIGLFLMIPFLNILYHNIPTKRQKQILILTLFSIISLFPTLSKIVISGYVIDIFPDWWKLFFPILMYYIGSYLREYKIHINKLVLLPITILYIYLQTVILYYYAQGNNTYSIPISENSAFSVILACLVFLLLYDLKTHSKINYKIMAFFSETTFAAYLMSYCFDETFYSLIPLFTPGSKYYFALCSFITMPIIFLCSILSGYIVNLIIKIVTKIIKNIKAKLAKRTFEA